MAAVNFFSLVLFVSVFLTADALVFKDCGKKSFSQFFKTVIVLLLVSYKPVIAQVLSMEKSDL